jgi:hypothetical protein
LIAELVAGELARVAGLTVPEIVFVQLDPELARTEPDTEIQDLIRASAGLNLALDYLPGSVTFDPLAEQPTADVASAIVWHDAFTTNVDRTPRNANMLVWHRKLWLIDHGAALYFHHSWPNFRERSTSPFAMVKDHVLLSFASTLEAVDEKLTGLITPEVVAKVVALIPDDWLEDDPLFIGANSKVDHRDAYRQYLVNRLESPRAFVEEAIRARSAHL